MHFHLPKPLHGWRAFIGEVGTIVLGVLIALGAGQLAEEWTWHGKVDAAETGQLRREQYQNFGYAAEQVAVQPCLDAQLATLSRRVHDSGAILTPAPVYEDASGTFVYRVPTRPYGSNSWQSINGDGTANHLEELRQHRYAQIYTQTENLLSLTTRSEEAAEQLIVLADALPLDPATRFSLLSTIAEQRGRSRFQALVAGRVMASARQLGQMPAGRDVDNYLERESGTRRFCILHHLPLADWRRELANSKPIPD